MGNMAPWEHEQLARSDARARYDQLAQECAELRAKISEIGHVVGVEVAWFNPPSHREFIRYADWVLRKVQDTHET